MTYTAKCLQEWFTLIDGSNQSVDFKSIKIFRYFHLTVNYRSPSNLAELEQICLEE